MGYVILGEKLTNPTTVESEKQVLLLYSFQYIKTGLYMFMLISLGLPPMLQMLFFSHAQRIWISTALVELILETLSLFLVATRKWNHILVYENLGEN